MAIAVFMESMKLTDKVEKWCESKKRTLKSVAVAAGFAPSRFTDWKNLESNRKPTLSLALAMAREMKVTLDSLADDEIEFLVPAEDPNFTYLMNVITDLGLTWRQAAQILMQHGKGGSGSPVLEFGQAVDVLPVQPKGQNKRTDSSDVPPLKR